MRHGFGATTYTCSAAGRWARTACAPRPTSTIRPCAAASAITRSVTCTIVASSRSTGGAAAEARNISGEATASVRASRSSRPGARSSSCATSAAGSPARSATWSTNSLSITVQPSAPATRRATSDPPEAYCRVMVMTGAPICSGLQVLAHRPADLVLVTALGEDLGCLHRIDLPADRHLYVHPHLLARERLDRLDLLAARGPLLFASGVALDRRPRRHIADPREQRRGVGVTEGVAHADLTGVDDGQQRPGAHGQRDRRDHVASQPQQIDDRSGTLGSERRGGEQQGEGDEEEDGAGNELAHGGSEGETGKRYAPGPQASGEEVRSPSGLAVPRPLRLGAGPHVAELFRARDPLFGDQALEHQLARRHHRGGVLLCGEPDLIHQVEP